MHIGDLQDRLRGLMAAVPGIDEGAARANLQLLARQDQKPDARFPDLAKVDGQNEVLKRAKGRVLVILDNFSVLADVDDENDAAAMSPVLAFLMKMKQAGIATILLHHSSKGGENYRGSSKLATTFEVIMGLARATGVESRHPASFDLEFGKFRGERNSTIEATTAWLQRDQEGTLSWVHKVSESAELKMAVDAVRSCSFTTQKEMAEALGMSVGKLSGLKTLAIGKRLIDEKEWKGCMETARARVQAEHEDFAADEEVPF
jgi:hypothetical protein